jgi:hypothetical protein
MTNWTDIHLGFAKKDYYSSKTYQQEWEEYGFTYQEAWEWIAIGFKPYDYSVKQWKDHNFTPSEAESWIDIGLDKYDVEFASYLRWKGHQPSLDLNLKQLKKEFKTWQKNPPAQEYLDAIFPKDQRNTIKELYACSKNLQGTLDLSDFVDLEELRCHNNKLTSLNLDNCGKLKNLSCSSNQLTELKVNHLTNFTELYCYNNQLTNLNLSNCEKLTKLLISDNKFNRGLSFLRHLVNLGELRIGNNSFFGSLEPLKNMRKLKELYISDTDIDSGLEYLPESVRYFWCSAEKGKDAKCKTIYNLFADEKGWVETEYRNEPIKNFFQKFQTWKETNPNLVNTVELEKTLDNLNLALVNGKVENETTSKVLDIFQFETEERIKEMRKQNQEYYEAKIIQQQPFGTLGSSKK